MSSEDQVWVPDACTLPTVRQPPRVAEFDDLFAAGLRRQERLSATRLRWFLDPAAEPAARDLTSRETECCAFFAFTFAPVDGAVRLDVEVPAGQVAVLDALYARAARPAAADAG